MLRHESQRCPVRVWLGNMRKALQDAKQCSAVRHGLSRSSFRCVQPSETLKLQCHGRLEPAEGARLTCGMSTHENALQDTKSAVQSDTLEACLPYAPWLVPPAYIAFPEFSGLMICLP